MSNAKRIPPEIARKLDQSLGRVKRILFVRGVCAVVAVATAAVLFHVAVLAMLGEIPKWVGWSLWTAGLVAVVSVAWFALLKPLSRKFTAADIALLIERRHPELEERLSTVVELAEAGDLESSKSLLAEITAAAVRDAGTVSPKKEFTSRTVKPRFLAALLALLVMGGLYFAFPVSTKLLVTAALFPSAEVDNIYASEMQVAPGDAVVLEGSPFTVGMADSGGRSSKAYVLTRRDGKDEASERMTQVGDGDGGKVFYEFAYPKVDESFSYRVKCGKGVTRAFRVEVVPEPSFDSRRIEIVHPAYTGRAPDVNEKNGAVAGLPGSEVKVSVLPSRPGLEGEAVLPGGGSAKGVVGADGRMSFEFRIEKSGEWGVRLWDANGFSNRMETAHITVAKDAPPEIKLVEPETLALKLPRYGELPMAWEVKEDFGIAKTTLEMCVGAGEWVDAGTLESASSGSVAWTGDTVVRFADKDFGKAGAVRFRVRVEDTLPADQGGPNAATSPEVVVTLVAQNTSIARQSLKSEIDETNKSLEDVRKRLENAKGNAKNAAGGYRSTNTWQHDQAKKHQDWCKGNMVNAEMLLASVIEDMEEGRLATGAETFKSALDGHLTPTRRLVEDVYLLARDAEKAEAFDAVVPRIQSCLDALSEARKRFNDLSKAAMDLQKLEDYAEREAALAEMAEKGEIDSKTLAEREAELERKFSEEFKKELSQNEEGFRDLQQAMKDAAAAAKEAAAEQAKADAQAEAQAKAEAEQAKSSESQSGDSQQQGDQQNGENQQGDQQQGDDQNGENPQSDQQQGQNQQGDQQNGENQQGDQQQGDEQNGENPQGDQQQGQQQQGLQQQGQQQGDAKPPSAEQLAAQKAALAAQEAAKNAADKIKGKAKSTAEKNNLPLERFEQGDESSEGSDSPGAESGSHGDGEPNPDAKPSESHGETKPNKKKRRVRKQSPQEEAPKEEGEDDWFKMKSESGAGAESSGMDGVPDEYRTLVREYFDAINKGGK